MIANKVRPDSRSYITQIMCYGRSKQPQKAEKVLRYIDELHKNGILKEGLTYRTYLSVKTAWELSHEPDKEQAIEALTQEMNNRFPFSV
jgi:hypothetical protein